MEQADGKKFSENISYMTVFRLAGAACLIGMLIMAGGVILHRQVWSEQGWIIFFFSFSTLAVHEAVYVAMAKFGKHKFRIPLLYLAIFVVAAVAFSSSAHAADLNPANTPLKEWIDTGNSANGLLCTTIGDLGGTGLFGHCPAGSGTAVQQVLKTFNLAVFSIAAIFLSWNLLSASISSANDGEFLGKSNHSTWGPMRVVIGGAMLVPAFGGFNLAQLIMVWATAVGVGIAGAAVSNTALPKIYSNPTTLLHSSDVAQAVAAPATCVAAWNSAVQQAKAAHDATQSQATMPIPLDPGLDNLTWLMTSQISDDGQRLTLNFGANADNAGGYGPADCGSVSFNLPQIVDSSDAGEAAIGAAVSNALQTEIPKLAAAYQSVAGQMVQGLSKDQIQEADSTLVAAKNAFDSNIFAAAGAAVAIANQAAMEATKGKGDWISIGFTPALVVKAAASLQKTTETSITSTPVKKQPMEPLQINDWSAYNTESGAVVGGGGTTTELSKNLAKPRGIEVLKNAFQDAVDSVKNAAHAVGNAVSATAAAVMNPVDTFNKMMKEKVAELGSSVASTISSQSAAGPLAGLVNLGLIISGWATGTLAAFFTAAGVLAVATALYPGFAVGGSLVSTLGATLMALCLPLLFYGVRLAAYIPFMISIIWAAAILNWLIVVVEALFGAPLWAMVHLDFEGEGLTTDRTGHGYMFLLNLLFRPVILVGLFYVSQNLIAAIFGLFIGAVTGFISNLSTSSASWWADLMIIIGAVWVVITFAEQIVSRAMGILFTAPDLIFGWVGGHFNTGGAGGDIEQSTAARVKGGIDGQGAAISGAARTTSKEKGGTIKASQDSGKTRPPAKIDNTNGSDE